MADIGYTKRNTFTPAPGYLLVLPLEAGQFDKEIKDGEARKGTVLAVGTTYQNGYGIDSDSPCKVNDIIFYPYNYSELPLNGEIYHIMHFDAVRGVING